MNDLTPKKDHSRLAKWSRRGFIGAGVLAGGGLLIGIGVRSGNPVGASGIAGGSYLLFFLAASSDPFTRGLRISELARELLLD